MLEVIKAKKTWRVTHANIVDTKDSEGANLKGKVLIEKSDILGRSFVKDGDTYHLRAIVLETHLH